MADTQHSAQRVPWQVTGNHWLTLPCLHPATGALHALSVLHRGARAAVELAGARDFLGGDAPALLRPVVTIDGETHELSSGTLAWERAANWLPTFTCTLGPLLLRGTLFAPFGRDADMPGAVYAFAVENRSDEARDVTLSLEGHFAFRQLRVRTPRAAEDRNRIAEPAPGVLVLEGAAQPGLVAVALAGDEDTTVEWAGEDQPEFALRRALRLAPRSQAQVAFYIAAGPERDGATATVRVLRRRGWRDLLGATRDSLRMLEQTTGNAAMDRLVNRNLLFAYFCAVGRALDDAHYYLVRSRLPWNERGTTIRDWEALMWTIPAVQLADSALARELLLRMCELHGYAPGRGVHYLDGTLFEPGFSLEGAASYAVAVERYIRETGDDQIVEEPALADTLYVSAEDIADRRAERTPLYSTEVAPSGEAVPYAYTLHGNAVVAQALEVFQRTLDEETAKGVQDPAAVRAALLRHFSSRRDGEDRLHASTDLSGKFSSEEDSVASLAWLPMYEAVGREHSTFRRTVKALAAQEEADGGAQPLARRLSRIFGPEPESTLQWLRRAPLDGGVAAEMVDAEGNVVGSGGDAALSGLLAWTTWYAIHALGAKP